MAPPHDALAHWTHRLSAMDIPVLGSTRAVLDILRADPDRADANLLADTVLRDPLMTLRVLVLVARRLGPRLATRVETVTGSLVLLGVEPFFNAFADLDTLEDRLAGNPPALAGALACVERARRAARLAAAFAVHRKDDSAEVLHQAALLQDISALLLWCEAPALALDMQRRQDADAQLRSADVQRQLLGVEVPVLDRALAQAWGLEPVLRDWRDPVVQQQVGARCVALAVKIARHLQAGWDNAALPDDFDELGRLLVLPATAAHALVLQVEA